MNRCVSGCRFTGCAVALLAVALTAEIASASYTFSGNGMQTLFSGSVADGALYVQSNTTWNAGGGHVTTSDGPVPYVLTTNFTAPVCDSVATSRLVLTLWGGNPVLVGGLSATVNSASVADLNVGGTGDSTQTFGATGINVYGSGSGVWLVSIPVDSALLHTNGTANEVKITMSDPNLTDGVCFDGRVGQATLWSVYQKDSLSNLFQYAVAEGSGDIYKTPTYTSSGVTYPTVMSREISLGSVNAQNVTSAVVDAMYTYGDKNQNDRLYFNNAQLGGDDVANKQNGSSLAVVPDLVSFDVTDSLSSNNTIRFSANPGDVPTPQEISLRPQLAILAVTSTPEPGTMVLLATGAAAVLLFAARGLRRPI